MLKVWLPLDGDLRNQGISDLNTIIMPTCATIDNTGKIGKCYTSDGSVAGVSTNFNFQASEFSIAAWVRINTRVNAWRCPIKLIHSTEKDYIGFCCEHNTQASYIGFHFYKTIDNTNTPIFDTYPITDMPIGEWVHLTVTYNGKTAIYYKNGIKINSSTIAAAKQNAIANIDRIIMLGSDGGRSGAAVKSSLNDVRVYDHCLSAAEVKEIAQGLVLHYKLDGGLFGNPNLLLNTHFDNRYNQTTGWDTTKNGTLLASNWGGYNSGVANQATCYHAHLKLFNNEYVYEYTKDTETWLGISQTDGLQNKLVAGKTYTFSCEQYSVTNTNYMHGGLYYFKTGATSAGFHLGYIYCNTNRIPNTWQKFTYTFTAPSDGDYSKTMRWYCYGHSGGAGTFYLRHLKLEEGSIATPWCPADSEMNIDRTIIEDSSGYNHNGIAVGSILTTADTARYNTATNLVEGASAINCGRGGMVTDSITVNLWIKSSAWANPISCTEGGGWNFESNGNGFRFPVYLSGVGYKATGATTTTRAQICNNQWHMLTGVYDRLNQKIRVYVDGNLEYEENTSSSALIGYHSGNVIWLGAEASGSATTIGSNGMVGLFSDFRIYCTPLLDIDVKQLYNVGMKIDKLGNMHPFELEENIGMVSNVKFVNNSANSVTYDAATDTYTIVSKADTSSWGYGVRLADDPPLWVPYGATYRWTAEIWTPIALSVNTDYNNTTGSADTNWSGNDNDATGTRLAAGVSIPANTWTRIYRGASNTNNGNTNHLPIRDYSSLGLVTNGQSNPVTWKVRHLQWYLIDNTFNPQLKRTGVFKSPHFTEAEEDLNKPAQLNKKMFSTNATQFIER